MKTFDHWRAAARAMRWARQQPGITGDSLRFGALTGTRWRGNGYDVRIVRTALENIADLRISGNGLDIWIERVDAVKALRILAALDLIPAELSADVPRQRVCHIAVCDDCGTEYEHDYTPHWPSAGEAADDAADGGEWWSGEGGALLCDHCKLKPHLFLISDHFANDCDRCDRSLEEHDPTDLAEAGPAAAPILERNA